MTITKNEAVHLRTCPSCKKVKAANEVVYSAYLDGKATEICGDCHGIFMQPVPVASLPRLDETAGNYHPTGRIVRDALLG